MVDQVTENVWNADVCDQCGNEVQWEEESMGALNQTWDGICRGCGREFRAELESQLMEVIVK